MSDKPDINRLIELQKLLLQYRAVERTLYIPPDNKERENDVEHSYSLAMTAWFLAPYFPKLDRDKLIRFALAHDLVEIYAGDTFSYAPKEEIAKKHEREMAALSRLKKEWPDFPDMLDTIEQYESRQGEEVKFVYALDKLMPAMLNYLGGGYIWHKYKLTIEDYRAEKEVKVTLSPDIYDYYLQLLDIFEEHLELFHKKKK